MFTNSLSETTVLRQDLCREAALQNSPQTADAGAHAVGDGPQVVCRPARHQRYAQAQAQGDSQNETVAAGKAVNANDLGTKEEPSDRTR